MTLVCLSFVVCLGHRCQARREHLHKQRNQGTLLQVHVRYQSHANHKDRSVLRHDEGDCHGRHVQVHLHQKDSNPICLNID